MAYYIPTTFFSAYTTDDHITIRWHGKNGIIGVVPVYNNIDDLQREHPKSEYLEIQEELGQA